MSVVLGMMLMTMLSCKQELTQPIEVYDHELSAREQYQNYLAEDSLISIDTKQEWFAISHKGLNDSVFIDTPYREQFIASAKSIGLRINATLGEQVLVIKDSPNLLIDIWRSDSTRLRSQVFAADGTNDTLSYPIDETGEYLIRFQSKIGDTIQPIITILSQPQNIMPVVGADNEDAWSRFGDPREAGRRVHEGVDIFKRRGTIILSAADGVVKVVKNEGMGGKQAWVRDGRLPVSHYYAHLDSPYVREGQFVARGDTIGTVGNTGNAKTTRPHLHYGMYMADGAVDPFPFIGTQRVVRRFRKAPKPMPTIITPDLSWRLRLMPSGRSPIVEEGYADVTLEVIGWTNGWWHVTTPSNRKGFVFDEANLYTSL